MKESTLILGVVLFLMILVCICAPVKEYQIRENARSGHSGTGLNYGGFRRIVNPIGIYSYPTSYTGIYPHRRYYPEFQTEFDENMLNCMDTCSVKQGEDFQECLKFCKELYPPNQYVVY
jgi:hypothetical protein